MYSQNIKKLKCNLEVNEQKSRVTHNIKNATLLPFQTRNPERVKFDNGFTPIIGELSRVVLQKKYENKLELEELVESIANQVEVENEEDYPYLKALIKQYLVTNHHELNILHPYLFQFQTLTDNKQSVGERAIALFLQNTLVQEQETLVNFFNDKTTKHIVTRLIISNLKLESEKVYDKKYELSLHHIKEIFNEDLEFLSKHPDFLMKNIDVIMAYYYFFYCSQLIIKMSKGFKANASEIEAVYYLLDTESASKNRKSIQYGYKYMKEQARDLLIQMNTLEHLNTLYGTKGELLFQIKESLQKCEESKQLAYLKTVAAWINEYRALIGLEQIEYTELTLESLEKDLSTSINKKIDAATKSRYALNFEEIAKRYFVKSRGSYGHVLNVKQDLLLIITAMCIKEEKMSLKQLFIEFERRGLFLDRYSQEEVTSIFNKLNLIDKKSDSGDAQYVKAIL